MISLVQISQPSLAATTAKMVDPTTRMALRTKYEKAGEEARKTDKAEWDRKLKYGKSEEGQIDQVMDILKIPSRETAREIVRFPKNQGIKVITTKGSKTKEAEYKTFVEYEEAFVKANDGAIFDDVAKVYVLYIDGKRHTTPDKSKVMKAKKQGLLD